MILCIIPSPLFIHKIYIYIYIIYKYVYKYTYVVNFAFIYINVLLSSATQMLLHSSYLNLGMSCFLPNGFSTLPKHHYIGASVYCHLSMFVSDICLFRLSSSDRSFRPAQTSAVLEPLCHSCFRKKLGRLGHGSENYDI